MSSSPTRTLIDVVMPAMGTSITEGTILEWSKNIGDAVVADESICDISTDKVDTECPSPAAGVVAEILVAAGETVDVGTVIARLASDDEHSATPIPTGQAAGSSSHAPSVFAPPESPQVRAGRYSPVVRRMSQVHGLDVSEVPGTGRGGRVTKRDVLAFLERANDERPLHSESPYRPDLGPEESSASACTPVPLSVPDDLGGTPAQLSRMRLSIGSAMRRSQETAATCHTVVECDMSRVEAARGRLGTTALPLVGRAVIEVLRDFRELNATLKDATITRYDRVHLGIAVSLGGDGLIVPVIHDAQDLSAEGLAARIKHSARRAREKQLRPDELRGATFTITNPGRSGAIIATPVINVPQVAILDLEAVVRRPVVVRDADGNEAIAVRPMTNLVLGWDHRAIDGVYAAQFLTALRRRLETTA